MDFWILDVFVRQGPRSGNPLAVVAAEPGALSDAQMQAIAFEFGFSETVFVTPEADEGGRWPVRIFTPLDEIPFAGHPTLGAGWVIGEQLCRAPSSNLSLWTGAGEVVVHSDSERNLWLTAPPVQLLGEPDAIQLCRAWKISPAALDTRFAVVRLDTGPVFDIVPLRSPEHLQGLVPVPGAPGMLYAIAPDPRAADRVHVRMFAPSLGVDEDPATGSAAVCLGRYLLDTDYLGQGETVSAQILQGQQIGRPSLLRVRAERLSGRDVIRVGGRVRPFAHGQLTPPG